MLLPLGRLKAFPKGVSVQTLHTNERPLFYAQAFNASNFYLDGPFQDAQRWHRVALQVGSLDGISLQSPAIYSMGRTLYTSGFSYFNLICENLIGETEEECLALTKPLAHFLTIFRVWQEAKSLPPKDRFLWYNE